MPVRLLGEEDIDAVMQVQSESYGSDLLEPPAVFSRKMALFPEGAVGRFNGSMLAGYLFCHPWTAGAPAPFSAEDLALPKYPDALYVHDLAVRPACRARGVAEELLDVVYRLARELSFGAIALVAVQGSEGFWARQGFVGERSFEYLPGISAVLMRREPDRRDRMD